MITVYCNCTIKFMVEPFYRNMEFQSLGILQHKLSRMKHAFPCLLGKIKIDFVYNALSNHSTE